MSVSAISIRMSPAGALSPVVMIMGVSIAPPVIRVTLSPPVRELVSSSPLVLILR